MGEYFVLISLMKKLNIQPVSLLLIIYLLTLFNLANHTKITDLFCKTWKMAK